MLLSDGFPASSRLASWRAVGVALALAGSVVASGCTVRPLYGDASPVTGAVSATSSALSSIAVAPAETRYEQEVRNHLVFLLAGGAGEPASPRYVLRLKITERKENVATVQVTTSDNEPTAGAVTLTAKYDLTEADTGTVVARGERLARSSYDISRQRFAAVRALRDAEDRAARELAEQLRLALAQDLDRSATR